MPLLAINHHYVRDVSPPRGIHAIGLDELVARLEPIRREFRFISQQELLEAVAAQSTQNLAVVTFDDGLQEQAIAATKLRQIGIPCICFVPTLPFVEKRLLDVHRIHLLRALLDDAKFDALLLSRFGTYYSDVSLEDGRKQYRYDTDVAVKLKYFLNFVLSIQEREEWSMQLFSEVCGSEAAAAEELYMSVDALHTLTAHDQIGSHGHSHMALAKKDLESQKSDLEKSIGVLKKLTGKTPIGVAYPYGGPTAVNTDTLEAAHSLDFKYGFTMERGLNLLAGTQNPLALKRIDTNDIKQTLSEIGAQH